MPHIEKMVDIDHKDAILRSFILFVQTANTVLKYGNAHFYKEASLSATKFMVLRILAYNGGTMRPSEIARWMIRSSHDITTLVNRMELDGLVISKRNDRDQRYVDITLSDKGRKVLTQAEPVAREIVNQVMLSISEDYAILLEKLLRILRQNSQLRRKDKVE